MSVYVYVKPETAEKICADLRLQLSAPTLFNDPFDCHPRFYMHAPHERAIGIAALALRNSEREVPEEHIQPLAEWEFNRNEQSSRGELTDAVRSISFLVTCFTRTRNHPLMWAHYADQHRGVLFEIDETISGFGGELRSVVYSDSRPQYKLTSIDIASGSEKSDASWALCKALEWAYEQEVRLILHRTDKRLSFIGNTYQRGYISLPPEAIRSLTFGCRAEGATIAKIEAWKGSFSSHAHISLRRAIPDQEEYRLNYVDIDS